MDGWNPNSTVKAVGDFNGDGKDDLLLADSSVAKWYVFTSNGNSLGNNSSSGLWMDGWSPNSAAKAVGDFNGDGKDDLLLGDGTTAKWYVFTSNGNSLGNNSSSGLWRTGFNPNAPTWVGVASATQRRSYSPEEFVNALRATSTTAQADALLGGLNGADLTEVKQWIDARWPSSRTYGGANWQVDTAAEAERTLDTFVGSAATAQDILLSGLAASDRAYVQSQFTQLYTFSTTPETTPDLSDPEHEDGSPLLGDELTATASSTALRCRYAHDGAVGERKIQGVKKKGGPIENMAVVRFKVGFCWKKDASMARPNSRTPFVYASGNTLNGFGKLGYRVSYGSSVGEASGRRTIQQKTVPESRETVAYFAQDLDVLSCSSTTTSGDVSVTLTKDRISVSAGVNVSKTTSGCDLVDTYRHQIFGRYNGSAKANIQALGVGA
jgi:hypothetical protein